MTSRGWRTLGTVLAIIGGTSLMENKIARNDFYRDYLSRHEQITPEIRAEARAYARDETWEQLDLFDLCMSFGMTALGVYLAIGSGKKEEKRSSTSDSR